MYLNNKGDRFVRAILESMLNVDTRKGRRSAAISHVRQLINHATAQELPGGTSSELGSVARSARKPRARPSSATSTCWRCCRSDRRRASAPSVSPSRISSLLASPYCQCGSLRGDHLPRPRRRCSARKARSCASPGGYGRVNAERRELYRREHPLLRGVCGLRSFVASDRTRSFVARSADEFANSSSSASFTE